MKKYFIGLSALVTVISANSYASPSDYSDLKQEFEQAQGVKLPLVKGIYAVNCLGDKYVWDIENKANFIVIAEKNDIDTPYSKSIKWPNGSALKIMPIEVSMPSDLYSGKKLEAINEDERDTIAGVYINQSAPVYSTELSAYVTTQTPPIFDEYTYTSVIKFTANGEIIFRSSSAIAPGNDLYCKSVK